MLQLFGRIVGTSCRQITCFRYYRHPRFESGGLDVDDDEIFVEDIIENEVQSQTMTKPGVNAKRKTKKDLENEHKEFLKRKIIERKEKMYFHGREPNLLTWSARAQIKYLNYRDPIHWTPEVLAQSFPVSKEAIIKILRNNQLPFDEWDIFKHDQKVYRNWLKLKEASKTVIEGGPVNPEYRLLVESEKIGLIKNAAGIKTLPSPHLKQILTTMKDLLERQKSTINGEFSAILKDYEESKQKHAKNKDRSSKSETQSFDTIQKDDTHVKYIGFDDPAATALLTEISDTQTFKSRDNIIPKENGKSHSQSVSASNSGKKSTLDKRNNFDYKYGKVPDLKDIHEDTKNENLKDFVAVNSGKLRHQKMDAKHAVVLGNKQSHDSHIPSSEYNVSSAVEQDEFEDNFSDGLTGTLEDIFLLNGSTDRSKGDIVNKKSHSGRSLYKLPK